MMSGNRVPKIIGIIVAVLLQVLLAPLIQIGAAVPNFVLSYVIALAFAGRGETNYLIAFFGGLAYDLLGIGPVGSMALVCVFAMFACSSILRIVHSDSILVQFVLIAIACLVCEAFYGILMMACGIDVSLLDALVLRMIPCALYDMVIAILAFIVTSGIASRGPDAGGVNIIDNRMD